MTSLEWPLPTQSGHSRLDFRASLSGRAMSQIRRRQFLLALGALLAAPRAADAQQGRVYRVGVIHQGGPYSAVIDGLRDGLRELGLEEGKQFVLHVRDGKGDLKSVEATARDLEREP